MNYTHIIDSERRRIDRLLASKTSKRKIARELGRSLGTIIYEIKTNSVKGEYIASKAIAKSRKKRKDSKIQCLKVVMDTDLKKFVIDNIKDDQSPEGISGRLKNVEKKIQYASTKAVYKFVKSVHGRQIEKHLYSKAVKKKGGPKRGSNKPALDGRTMIDKRPKKVEKRKEFGHFEGDFIESGKDGKGSILVLVERKTRYPFLVYTENKTTEHINNLITETLKDFLVKSITLDNDLSFKKHKEMSKLVNAEIFFCHSYCSSEKGTVENRNKATRRYIPKSCDISKYQSKIKEVENKLRNKFMKCLKYKTPEEVWNAEIQKVENKKESVKILATKKASFFDANLLAKSDQLQRFM